ncbi:MAG: phosphoglucosamine mutase [Acidimicrobiales bacterium]|nr:phosphoglucosamine mutase [Acidimicrobiales bacterium]
MRLRFGTDGVRGTANLDLSPEAVLALGRATARVLQPERILIGRDTRQSGPLLQAAFSAGLSAEGVEVTDLGVIPTPGVAYLSAARGVPGAVVSASHNPFTDNGIKLFQRGGRKLEPEVEQRIEQRLEELRQAGTSAGTPSLPGPANGQPPATGSLHVDHAAAAEYRAHLVGCLEGRRLDPLHVVVDCAHGAATGFAPTVLAELGAQVDAIGDHPDGTNINAGYGSTDLRALRAAVIEHGADLGLAFDGDADRVLAVDHTGADVDGDQLLALLAFDLAGRDQLPGQAVVVTVMSNLGLRQALARGGLDVVETPVGDRHVLDVLERKGLALGGEQSGHIILRRLATTGDGLLTGLMVLDLLVRQGRTLAEAAGEVMTRFPQVLRSVAVADPARLEGADAVWAEVAEVRAALGEEGRVVVRRSGTEPVVRVMVEATTGSEAGSAADRLCEAIVHHLG